MYYTISNIHLYENKLLAQLITIIFFFSDVDSM